MKKNLGGIDRIIRGAAALTIIVLLLTKNVEGGSALLMGFAALILLFTSVTSFCPCYIRLNINTSRKKEEEEAD
jgi:hypothetical protein